MPKIWPNDLPRGEYSRCYKNHKKKLIALVTVLSIGVILTIIITAPLSQCNIAYSCSPVNEDPSNF